MKTKIRVHGKSQGRTALGIINAYLKLNPDSTSAELQQAFPKSLNRRCSADNIIIPIEKTVGYEKMFFEQEDELIVFKTGERFALVEIWSKEDFDTICEHAKQYGITVAEEGTKPFEKGSFELEYLDEDKKKFWFKWWWVLLLILLFLLMIFCCKKCCCHSTCSNTEVGAVENVTVEPSDTDSADNNAEQPDSSTNDLISDSGASISITLPDGNVLDIAKNSKEYKLFSFLYSSDAKVESDLTKGWITLDKMHFDTGKAHLSSDSENQLKSIAGIMQFFPNSHFKIGGYTDNTGNDAINMRLSSERAKATVEKLVSLGIDANRMTHEGYGIQRPVCPSNDTDDCRAANRRVDIRVTQK